MNENKKNNNLEIFNLIEELINQYQTGFLNSDFKKEIWSEKVLTILHLLLNKKKIEYEMNKYLNELFLLIENDKDSIYNPLKQVINRFKKKYPELQYNSLNKKKKWNNENIKNIIKNYQLTLNDGRIINEDYLNANDIDYIVQTVQSLNRSLLKEETKIKIYYDGHIEKFPVYKIQTEEEYLQLWNDYFQKALNDLDNE